ncbi:N-acetylmuramoyl-L-alanine amidase family protein [Gorillibacterium sp. CAU 1737]|uniref:N-acetylmuramoyl-L-alanine amidase family protein n=1 Tax=Gorillibacterium sp. CAU 1737 TaxID=3140362 RepID=UPI0032619888
MKKRFWSFLSLAVLLFLLPTMTHAAADSSIRLYLNEVKLESAVPPYLSGSTTLVPARVISEQFGATVSWDNAAHKMTVIRDEQKIEVFENSTLGYVNGVEVTLPAAPIVKSGTTMLPVRFIANLFDFTVQWDGSANAVYLKTPDVMESMNGLTELWSITSTATSVTLQAGSKLEANVFALTDPNRIVIDVPNAVVGGGLPRLGETLSQTVASSNPLVSQIRYAVNDPATSTVRIVLETNGQASYEISRPTVSKLTLTLKKPASGKRKVVIDAGHGGTDPGAISLTGKSEKTFNLSMALKVKALLDKEKEIDAYLTRSTDTFVTLDNRAAFANQLGADVFVSIHGNNFAPTSNGTQTYYYNSYSKALADTLHKYVVAATGFRDDKVRREDFRVIRKTDMPGVLLEIGYLSNKQEEALMFTNSFQDKVATAIVKGIKVYLGL